MTEQEICIPREAAFCVRGGLQRGLLATLESIQVMRATSQAADAKGTIWERQLQGGARFQQQWLVEAIEAFKLLPEDLRPDMKEYEGITLRADSIPEAEL